MFKLLKRISKVRSKIQVKRCDIFSDHLAQPLESRLYRVGQKSLPTNNKINP